MNFIDYLSNNTKQDSKHICSSFHSFYQMFTIFNKNMMYTTEYLQDLTFDEVKEIAKSKSNHGIVPQNFDKSRLIKEIIHFQLIYGDTEIKKAPSLNVGDIWLGGGVLFEDTDIQYSAWHVVTSIYIKPLSKEEIKALMKNPLIPNVLSLPSLINQDKYIITYKTVSVKFDDLEWEKSETDITDTITVTSDNRFIVSIPSPTLTHV